MRKLKFDDPEKLEKKIEDYFEKIKIPDENGDERPPTMSGLALSLGTTRKTLLDYINAANESDKKGKQAECGELLILAKARIECYLEERLITNPSRSLEFVLKNGYHGWGDKVTVGGEVEVKHQGDAGAVKMTDEELMNRISVLQAKALEFMKREGVADADGR